MCADGWLNHHPLQGYSFRNYNPAHIINNFCNFGNFELYNNTTINNNTITEAN